MLHSKIENAHWAEKKDHNALWELEEQSQREMYFKWTLYNFSNLLIKIHVT